MWVPPRVTSALPVPCASTRQGHKRQLEGRYSTVSELDQRFDDPPRSFSPVPIWWWSGEKLDAQLDLGRVRGTAEVHVNGEAVGVRIWSPYTFDVTNHLRPGENELQVWVYNTLGPY